MVLVISRFGFEGWFGVLIASVPDLCILFTFNSIMVEAYAALFGCTTVDQALRLNDGFDMKL